MSFKLPKIELPTDEEMKVIAEKWWERDKKINFGEWNQALKDASYPFVVAPMPDELVKSLIAITDGDKKAIDNAVYHLEKIVFQAAVRDNNWNYNSFFAKLITRSPKDILADFTNHGKPKPITDCKELAYILANSPRTFEDLCLLRYTDKAALVIRPYIEFEPWREFRCLVKDSKIVGISQYYYESVFEELTDLRMVLITAKIKAAIENILLPNLDLTDFVADFVMEDDKTVLLEINPYGSSDPCLFIKYSALDGSTRFINKDDPENVTVINGLHLSIIPKG